MQSLEQSDAWFLPRLKRWAIPAGSVAAFLAFVVKLREYFNVLGGRVFALLLLIVVIAWALYVYRAKPRQSRIELSSGVPATVPAFRRRDKWCAVFVVLVCSCGVIVAFIIDRPSGIPELTIRAVNATRFAFSVKPEAKYFLTLPETATEEKGDLSGRVLLRVAQEGEVISIPSKGEMTIRAEFLNEEKVRDALTGGEHELSVAVTSVTGITVTAPAVPFTREHLENTELPLLIDENATERLGDRIGASPRTPDREYPGVDGLADAPTINQVDEAPRVRAKDVSFKYRNASGVDLKLLLHDWTYWYHPVDVPLAPQTPWRIWDFPANDSYSIFADFERSSGWFSFFVEEVASGRCYLIGTKNIFRTRIPSLTVRKTGDEAQPFKGDWGKEE